MTTAPADLEFVWREAQAALLDHLRRQDPSHALRRVARSLRLIPVDPDANLVPAMQAGAFGLAHGKILVLFPEGERSMDGTVRRFKKGAPILAQHLGVPIVPVAIKGAFDIWPRNRGLSWSRIMPWSGHRVTITIGEPMRFDESADYTESTRQLHDRVDALWRAN